MDTQFLESFISVVESGSIAAAARKLNVTPNAVSQRIKALEAEIGLRLVSRDGRTVRPTEAGASIFERARLLVRDAAELKIAAARSLGADKEIKLGAIGSAVSGILPDVLMNMTNRHPEININVIPGLSNFLYRKVLGGEIDAAIIVEPHTAIAKICEWKVIREEPLIVLAHSSMADQSPLDLLMTQPYIRYRREECGRLADEYLRHKGIQPRMIFELDGLDAIARMVDRGLGISIVPDWAQSDAHTFSLVRHRLADSEFSRRLGLIWVSGSHRIGPLQQILGEIGDASRTISDRVG